MRKLVLVVYTLLTVVALASCEESKGDRAASAEQESQGQNYAGLSEKQPAEAMDYSPTREGVNKWMNTWEEPGKLAYVYLMGANGNLTGYYVFEGLPISYCAQLTPPDRVQDYGVEGAITRVAPNMDGVYYSGGQCNQYYGFDATTGAYLEFSIGGSQNYLLYDQPLPRQDTEPLGFTTIEEAQKEE